MALHACIIPVVDGKSKNGKFTINPQTSEKKLETMRAEARCVGFRFVTKYYYASYNISRIM